MVYAPMFEVRLRGSGDALSLDMGRSDGGADEGGGEKQGADGGGGDAAKVDVQHVLAPCSIWLVIPAGFPPGCQQGYKSRAKRSEWLKSALFR
jgi:hypothetical protein